MPHPTWDPHLHDALILVAYMAVGVVLGALSRHVKAWGIALLCVLAIAGAVVWSSWPYVDPRFGAMGLLTTFAGGFVYYTGVFAGLLLLPFACTRLTLNYVARRASAK